MNSAVIPTPAAHRLRRFAARGLPVGVFVVLCAVSAYLWQYQTLAAVLVGEVEVVEHVVSSPQPGMVARFVPSEGQSLGIYVAVAKDQLLVQLDDLPVREQYESIYRELSKVSGELSQEALRVAQREALAVQHVSIPLAEDEASDDSRSTETETWDAAQHIIEQSLSSVTLSQKELDLRKLDFELAQAQSAVAAGELDEATLSLYQQQRELAADELFDLRSEIRPNYLEQWAKIDDSELTGTSRLLLRSLANRVREVEVQHKAARRVAARLDITSPVDGQIDSSLVQEQQAVVGGQPLMTVIPKRGATIVVYARELGAIRPYVGMPVTLRSRTHASQQVQSAVEFVGPKVEEIPRRHRGNPNQTEWGRPMRIPVPADWIVEPGSLLDVIIEPS